MTTQVKVKALGGRIRVRSDPAGIAAAGGPGFRDLLPGDAWTVNFPADVPTPISLMDLETRENPATKSRTTSVVEITNLDGTAVVSVQMETGGFAPDLPLGGNEINIPGRQKAQRILPGAKANFIIPNQDRILIWPNVT